MNFWSKFWICTCYSYQLPEPSRSRDNTINIFDPAYKQPQYHQSAEKSNTVPINPQQFGYSLVPIYIPNEGYRYFVVVPIDKWNYLNSNHISGDDRDSLYESKFDKYDKYNGRYNAKLKKYKAYEKFSKPAAAHSSVATFNQQQQVWNAYYWFKKKNLRNTILGF